jgi:hypothetical protein
MVAVIAGVKTAKTEEILFSLITQYVNQRKMTTATWKTRWRC